MNKVGKAGAILTLIGSGFMIVIGFLFLVTGGFLFSIYYNIEWYPEIYVFFQVMMIILGIFNILFGILNVIFSSLVLAGKTSFRVTTGVISIVSILFAWALYFIPAILLLVGGILSLCGKKKENEETKIIRSNLNVVKTVS